MALYIITYDVRAKHPFDYQPLWDQLNDWNAAHLQNSVWLAELRGPAETVRDILLSLGHPDDTVCLIQLPEPLADWAVVNCRPAGLQWLQAH